MPRYGASKTDIGIAAGNLGASLLGGFGRRQGQMDGYRQLVNMTQAEQNQLENDELRRVASLDPYQQTFNDMGLIGAEAEKYRQAMTTGQIPEGLDTEKLRQGLALFNVYQRGGKVSDVEKALGDAHRNYIGRQVTPDNIANIGGMIGALDGKPMEGLQAQLTTGIARGEEQPNTMRALMASQGKGLYDNMPGGVFNIDTGEQNINDLGQSTIIKNQALAKQANAGATENLAQARKASPDYSGTSQPMPEPSGVNVSPLPPKLTEAQSKAAVFASQMRSASKNIDAIEGSNDLSKFGNQIDSVMAGGLTNMLSSSAAQKYKQAQRQWAESFLRIKTGAAANKEEVENNIKTFFPQVGDGPEVIKQKAEQRKQAEEDVIYSSGPAAAKFAVKDEPPISEGGVDVGIKQDTWDSMPPEQKKMIKDDVDKAKQTDPFRGFTPEQVKQFLKEHPDWKP